MKIIVTGGAGFIGSHIVDKYISLGHKVTIIDNLSTGFKKNINAKAKFYKADIRNSRLINKIFAKEKPEIVNHQAALASVVVSMREPIVIQEINLLGTINLLLAAGKQKIKKFIFASTGGAMYGYNPKLPANESSPNPVSPYGLSKLLAEEAIKFYSREMNFPYLILRYANVYGPRQNPKGEAGVVAIFTGLMKQNKPPTIFGDGNKTRDYVFVEDIAQANVLALKRGINEILNLGLGKEISDQQIFEQIAKETGFSQKPKYAPFRPGELVRSALNAQRAQKILGWRPKHNLVKGIHKTVSSFK